MEDWTPPKGRDIGFVVSLSAFAVALASIIVGVLLRSAGL